jgi:hypothetical protein
MKCNPGEQPAASLAELTPVPVDDTHALEPYFKEDCGLRLVGPSIWCRACGAIHEKGRCGGEVRASGPERHAWRGVFESARGREVHGVLVAPAEGRWRARIVTYPRILWTFPGMSVTLKFVADHPLAAERAAIDYIKNHCARIGQQYLPDEEALAIVGPFDPEAHDGELARQTRRHPRMLPILFGTEAPEEQTETMDLSEHGLFIATSTQLARGTRIRMLLDVGPCRMPLQGVVAWSRAAAEPGRPCGLGIELYRAPALYLDYVRRLP